MNSLQTQQGAELVDTSVYGNFTKGELDTIRQTIAKDLNDPQFALFMRTAHGWGLNPFLGHIHGMAYGGKLSIQVAVEGYEFKAEENYKDEYLGCEVQLVHENDKFSVRREKDGDTQVLKVVEHEFGFPRGKVIGGYAIARRKGHPDFTVLMEIEEVEELSKKDMWKKWFNDMFKKHIKKRALKGQFRLSINEDEPVDQRNPIDATPSYQQSVIIDSGAPSAKQIQTGENEFQSPEQILVQKREEVRQKMVACGMNNYNLEEFAMNSSIGKLPKEMDARELVALSRFLDVELQAFQNRNAQQQASLLDDLPPELQ